MRIELNKDETLMLSYAARVQASLKAEIARLDGAVNTCAEDFLAFVRRQRPGISIPDGLTPKPPSEQGAPWTLEWPDPPAKTDHTDEVVKGLVAKAEARHAQVMADVAAQIEAAKASPVCK